MNIIFPLVVLLFRLCLASDQFDFYHIHADEISSHLDTPEFADKLDSMNKDSLIFELSKGFQDRDHAMRYLLAQEQVAKVLFQNIEKIDKNSPQIKVFIKYLLDSIEQDLDSFSDENLMDVLGLLVAAGTSELILCIGEALLKFIPRLNSVQRLTVYEILIKFASIETCFVIPEFVKKDFLSQERIETFLNEYTLARFRNIPVGIDYSDHAEIILMNVIIVSHADGMANFNTYELVLSGLKQSVSSLKIYHFVIVLKSLDLLMKRIDTQPELIKLVIDILFNENLATGCIDHNHSLNELYTELIIKCSKANSEYFVSAARSSNRTTATEVVKLYTKASICINNLKILNEDSSEFQFRLGLSSAKNLHSIFKSCPSVLKSVSDLHNDIKATILLMKKVYMECDHRHNLIGLHIISYVALLEYELFKDANSRIHLAGNISYAIGHLILYTRDHLKVPMELIAEVIPILDEVIEGLLICRKTIKFPTTPIELAADMEFIKLHKSEKTIRNAKNHLCYSLIISLPVKELGFFYVRDIPGTDEAEFSVAAFIHFVKEFIKSPKSDDIPQLKEYFDYLVRKKFLTRTEIEIINRVLNFK